VFPAWDLKENPATQSAQNLSANNVGFTSSSSPVKAWRRDRCRQNRIQKLRRKE
jgi:hypothetical protein